MAEERTQRRLAAILAADVVGYTRLMGADEAGTLAVLKARRRDVLGPLVAKHHGRVFKITGDGVLIEFASAVNAIQCAVDLQQAMAAASNDEPEDRHIILRIGVNLGDVMVEGGDLYGDGVNVAARLEALAEPGGIVVSGAAYEQVKNRVSARYEDLGSRTLKNVSEPVRVYKIGSGDSHAASPSSGYRASGHDKPSVAILPFVSIGSGDEGEALADGLTEDITAALSRSHNLLVISRTSAFAFKGAKKDLRSIAGALNADYLVEGSVRRSGQTVRVTAQLIDGATGHHVWADKYDGSVENTFEIQDQITRAISGSMLATLFVAAWHGLQRGAVAADGANREALAAFGRAWECTPEAYRDAAELADKALAKDPTSLMGKFARIWAYCDMMAEGDIAHEPANHARVLAWTDETLAIAPQNDMAHFLRAYALANAGRIEDAAAECETARAINPNSPLIIGDLGVYYSLLGRADEAIAACELAFRISPRDPASVWWHHGRASAYFAKGRYEDARTVARRISQTNRGFIRAGLLWAAAAAALELMDEADTAIAHCLKERADLRLGNAFSKYMIPFTRRMDQDRLVDFLRKAGLPK